MKRAVRDGWVSSLSTLVPAVWLWAAVVMLTIATSVCAVQQLIGTPVKGLKGSIVTEREAYLMGEHIKVTLTLTNISSWPHDIAPWPGNWFVQVFDEKGMILPPKTSAADVLRPLPLPRALQPGESWSTQIDGLRFVAGLPGSTPLWEYAPLKPGIYWIGAEYSALPDAKRPGMWTGGLNCKWAKITVFHR